MLAAIGKLVIADDTVLPQEHALLDDYYALIAKIPARPEKNTYTGRNRGSLFARWRER